MRDSNPNVLPDRRMTAWRNPCPPLRFLHSLHVLAALLQIPAVLLSESCRAEGFLQPSRGLSKKRNCLLVFYHSANATRVQANDSPNFGPMGIWGKRPFFSNTFQKVCLFEGGLSKIGFQLLFCSDVLPAGQTETSIRRKATHTQSARFLFVSTSYSV